MLIQRPKSCHLLTKSHKHFNDERPPTELLIHWLRAVKLAARNALSVTGLHSDIETFFWPEH